MDSITQRVDQIFAPWDKPDSPGCSLVVVKDGAIVYKRGYGSAHLEHGVPITPTTAFHIASISKQFAAMAVLLLQQDGRLSIKDDIHKHLPELPVLGHTITIQHLIHTRHALLSRSCDTIARAGGFSCRFVR
jgi:CubicO group peptidase (beta-lactamase class C family)